MTQPRKSGTRITRDETNARLALYPERERQVRALPVDLNAYRTSRAAWNLLADSRPRDPYPGIALSHRQRYAVATTPKFMLNPELEPDVDEPDWA